MKANVENLNLENNTVSRKKPFDTRVHEIDFVRGLLMMLVLLDHVLNRVMIHFKGWGPGFREIGLFVQNFYWNGALRNVVQPLCLIAFCLVSGLSTAFSKNNWKRNGLMIIVWALVLVFTCLFAPMMGFYPIYFNVIAVLAWSSLIYCFLQNKTWKSVLAYMLIFGLITFCVVIPIMDDLFIYPWNPWEINYSSQFADYFIPFLYKPVMFDQSDYMSLFPYICFFFLGALGATFIYKDKKSIVKKKFEWERPFCFVGRHSLIFYLAHQVVMMPIFMILDSFMKV